MIVAKYKFNPNTYSNLIPEFNSAFTSYTKSDTTNSDGTITRTIESNSLPTRMRFGNEWIDDNYDNEQQPRRDSLLEVISANMSSIKSASAMFRGCSNVTSVDLSNVSNVTDFSVMFESCSSLTSLDTSDWNTSNVFNMSHMFRSCSSLTQLDLNNWDTSKVTNMSNMFQNCSKLTQLDVSNWNTSKVTVMNDMFSGCSSLTQLDVSSWDTSKVTDMNYAFYTCSSLTSLDLSNWDTSKVTVMNDMFNNCYKLTSLNVSNWNTSQVTKMDYMFSDCYLLTSLDLNNWNTSNVTDMADMFENCTSLTSLNISNWDTSKVTNMNSMFNSCTSLTSLDINNWNISQATDIHNMFSRCRALTSLDLSNWDTSNVTDMSYLFEDCPSLTQINLSNWDTSKVTDMTWMFYDCTNLTSLDISNFNTDNVVNIKSMFKGCSSLRKVNLKYSNSSTILKIHENLPDRSSTTKGYILSLISLTLNKNWEIFKTNYKEFYLPQPLCKIGDLKDRFYWDENKGHYCIEQKLSQEKSNGLNWMIVDQDGDFICFRGYPLLNTYKQSDKGLCNKLTCYEQYLLLTIPKEGIALSGNDMHIVLPKTRGILSTEQLEVFVNDLFVIWELETPIIIDLPHLNKKFTFDSYAPSSSIDIPNSTLKPSKAYLDAPIARYRCKILKPSTQYNVQFDCKGDSGIKVNLGGTEVTFTPTSEWTRKNLTITTPSELVNDKLSISNVGITSNNKINNVMLFSEVIAQEPDYIDGIQSIGEFTESDTVRYRIEIETYDSRWDSI